MTETEDGPQNKNRVPPPGEAFIHDLAAFVPSRGRDALATALTGAAGSQPAGAALPSLVRGEISTPDDHVVAAGRINPTATLLTSVLPPRSRATAHRAALSPDSVISDRVAALADLRALSDSLSPFRARWAASLPPDSPASRLNFPLIAALARRFEYPDASFVNDLSHGMPIAGFVEASHVLHHRTRNARVDYANWKRAIPETNQRVIDHILKRQGSADSNTCWEKTLAEVERGWVTPPIPLTDQIASTLPLTPRFALSEQHGLQERKIRVVDDFKASGINDLLSTVDTAIPDTLDAFLAMSTYFSLVKKEPELLAFAADFSHAYKHV